MALIDNIKTYKKIVIEIDEPIIDKVIAVQEDAESRYLDVQLFKDGVSFDLTGTKVRICMIKPDGKDVMNDGEITDPVTGRCQFLFTTQMLAACGVLQTQIIVFSETEEQIISTQIFNIYVTKKLLTNETIESTNEYGSLVILFQNIYEALYMLDVTNDLLSEMLKRLQTNSEETIRMKALKIDMTVDSDGTFGARIEGKKTIKRIYTVTGPGKVNCISTSDYIDVDGNVYTRTSGKSLYFSGSMGATQNLLYEGLRQAYTNEASYYSMRYDDELSTCDYAPLEFAVDDYVEFHFTRAPGTASATDATMYILYFDREAV